MQRLSEKKSFVPTSSDTSVPSAELVSRKPQAILGVHNCIIGTTILPEQRGHGCSSLCALNKMFFRADTFFSSGLVCVLSSYGSV